MRLKLSKRPILSFLLSALMIAAISGCGVGLKQKTAPLSLVRTDLPDISRNTNIAFIQPASAVPEEPFTIVKNSIPGVLPDNFVKIQEPPYHADTDVARLKELQVALNGDKKYLWAVRGGYGSARLLEGLSKPKQNKVIVGYSDITALHLLMNKWGLKSIHGMMPCDIARPTWEASNMHMLVDMLNKEKGSVSYSGVKPFNDEAKNIDSVQGTVIGGNLTLLVNSIGTSWKLDGKNKIIIIEDTGSKGYSLDRSLLHLRQANIFKHAKAVVFGQFIGGDQHVEYALKRFAKDVKIPVFKSEFFGHGDKNYPIPFGFIGKIVRAGEDGILKIDFDFSK